MFSEPIKLLTTSANPATKNVDPFALDQQQTNAQPANISKMDLSAFRNVQQTNMKRMASANFATLTAWMDAQVQRIQWVRVGVTLAKRL